MVDEKYTMSFVLLVLAIAPAVFFLWFFYSRDKYEKEPLRKVLSTYFLGMTSVIPAIVIEEIFSGIFPLTNELPIIILHSFIFIGLIEECCKASAIIPAFRSIEFNETMDGIVYSTSAALGFATVENIFYVIDGGITTGILRAILSVPGHALNGVIFGYFLGLAKFNKEKRISLIFVGLLLSTLLHGFWDLFSFSGVFFGVVGIYIIGWILFFKYRKRALYLSIFKRKYCLYCGNSLNKNDLFCDKCGEEQTR
jgi:RsiW-degrading membrane proteinase PrsW (M82 family)